MLLLLSAFCTQSEVDFSIISLVIRVLQNDEHFRSNIEDISGIGSSLWFCRFLVSTNWLDFKTLNYGLNVFFNAVTSQHFFNHQRFDFAIIPLTICLVQIDMNVAAQINLYSGV
ncbi:hypothetical protein ACTFIW_001771 [Dictyostelium discoideum]